MEDYNEKLNYGTEEYPRLRDRLDVTSALYGFNLYDRKEKKNLLFCKSKVLCEEGLTLLKTSELHFFESFKERIKFEDVVNPTKILIDRTEYSDDYYSIPTLKDLYKVALNILEKRFDNNCFVKCNVPNELDYTYEDVEKLPESFRKDAKNKLDRRIKSIKESKNTNREYEIVEKIIKEKNGELAWSILRNREDNEYEKIEIITPIKL